VAIRIRSGCCLGSALKAFFDGLAIRYRGRAVIDRDALLGSV